jgi:hypothetical protein
MTRGEAIKVVSESLVNVMAGQAVFIEDPSPLYDALVMLTGEDALEWSRRHVRDERVWSERGYHGKDGWSVAIR